VSFNERGFFEIKEQFFVNTNEFTRTAQYFSKHGVYTKADKRWDKREYEEFWDEEERKCRHGYSVGGVTITGEHYNFLNFSPIKRTVDIEDVDNSEIKSITKGSRTGTKEVSFPDFWDGHFHWFHARKEARRLGKNLIGGKARRKGFSYVGGSSANYNLQFIPNSTTILGAFDKKYLIKGDGVFMMAKNYADFFNKHTDFKKRRLVNQSDWIKTGFKIGQEEYGYKSEILALSFQDNPDAAIGKDIYEIDLEEAGKFPNIADVLDITIPALEDGIVKTGFLVVWGTGGSKGSNWEEFESQFYNPLDNDFLAFENIWDEGAQGTACGFFFPHIQNLTPYIDKNGNSLKKEALEDSDLKREQKKKNTTADKYLVYVGQRANCPREAFSQGSPNLFMTPELADHIRMVRTDPDIKHLLRQGQLLREENGIVRLVDNVELERRGMDVHQPLLNYPLKREQDTEGCFVEFYPRYVDPRTGQVPPGLYRVWHDPYALGKEKEFVKHTDSLGSTYVYEKPNLFTPTKGDLIVGSYTGRSPLTDTYNYGLYKVCEYYGGYDNMLMFENDRGDVKNFFEKIGKYHWLADEPEVLYLKQLTMNKTGRTKGISVYDDKRKLAGALYFKNWLHTIRGRDEAGNPRYTFQYIYDLGLLQEIEKWNLKGNFDRISAILVGMFDREHEFQNEVRLPTPPAANNYFRRKLFTNA
jgi:hypothetical protein